MTVLNKMPYRNALQFVNSITSELTSMYVYIGRPQSWESDAIPPDPVNDLKTEYDVWYDMTAMKRVTGNDVRLGFKKIDWTSGTVYYEYDDGVNLEDKNFYAVTDENKVYKCIYNNRNGQSVNKPTHTFSDIKDYPDGYRWKFMFQISDSLMRKFAVGDFLPISSDETIVDNATVGAIENIKVIDGGSGYAPSTKIPTYIYGDGTENDSAKCNIITNGGLIQNIVITDGGSGYQSTPDDGVPVLIRQVNDFGAVEAAYGIAVVNADQEITFVNLVINGNGYSDGEASIVRSSVEAIATTNSQGSVEFVDIVPGASEGGFRKAKAIVIAPSVTEAEVRPVISPFDGHGAKPEKELFANYSLLNMNFAYAEGANDFTVENDFRRIGLIENPYDFRTTTPATELTRNAKRTLIIDSVAGSILPDDIIYGQSSGAKGFVVDFIDGNKVRYITDPNLTNNIEFIIEPIRSSSGAVANIIEIQEPEVEPYSGDILFINNRTPINRDSAQIETITLVLEY